MHERSITFLSNTYPYIWHLCG